MKRKFYFMAGLAAIAMLFAACSNLGDDTTSVNPNKTARFGSDQELTLSLDNSSFIIERNIYPGDWSDWDQDYSDDDLASKVHYVLTGYTVDNDSTTAKATDSSIFKNSADKTLSYEEFPYAKLMKSEAKVSIKPLIWYFTLTAYATTITASDGEVTNTDACLVGTAWADMTSGAKTVVFDMKPAPKGTTAVGTAEMGLTFTPPDTFDKMTYGFYNESDTTPGTPDFSSPAMDSSSGTAKTTVVTLTKKANDSEDASTEGDEFVLNDGTNDVITSAKSKNEVDGYSYTYVLKTDDGAGGLKPLIANELTAGTYWFKAEFYDNQSKRIAVYIEKYIIDGTNTSTGDVELLEKAFNSAPQNIENLSLTYTFNGIEFVSKPGIAAHQLFKDGDTVQSTYTATLKWTDVADNEVGYEIWLKVFGDTDAITDTPTDVILSPRTAAATLTTYGLTAAHLQAGLTECKLTLATGKRYQISVRAYNTWSKGTSDTDIPTDYTSVYDATAESQGYDRFVPYNPRNDTTPGADNLTFGLYTIDYNLNSGAVKQTSAKTTASTVTHYIVPYIYMEQNFLVGENDTAETYPYIRRAGYTFVGWNELYGATGWPIMQGTDYNSRKYYYTDPGFTKKASDPNVFTSTGAVDTGTLATVVLDSIMVDSSKAKIPAPTGTNVGGSGTPGTTNYLATYSWTIPVWAKVESDEVKFYKDDSGSIGTDSVEVPVYAVVSPTRAEIKAHADAATGVKCTYSNVMLAEGELTNTDYLNRQVFASWETPLSFGINLPKYPDFKLTKQAAAGDPLVYAVGDEIEINVTNSQLSNVAFTVYKDDGQTDISTLFATGSDAIQTKNINDDGSGKLTWKTKVVTDPPAAGDHTYAAMTYYVKITATYTYADDPTNSLSGGTDAVEGYIFIRLTN